MSQKITLQQFIQELPVEEAVRKDLLERLAGGDKQSVKEDLIVMLTEAGLSVSALEALDQVSNKFEDEMRDIEQQSKNLIKAVSEEDDQHALDEVRKTIG